MNQREARSSIKALYVQAAAVAGLDTGYRSADRLIELISEGFRLVEAKRRPEATANLLRLMAEALDSAQKRGEGTLGEQDAENAHEKLCPIYPF
jgi:hypothetical protein